MQQQELLDSIFTVTDSNFEEVSLHMFRYQYQYNDVYRNYVDALQINAAEVNTIPSIPFLPIQFFKNKNVITGSFEAQKIFESSGTTTDNTSRHFIKDLRLYEHSFSDAFKQFYGENAGRCIIGLLPSYLERDNSSLVYMVDYLIRQSGHPQSGFYLHNFNGLASLLQELEMSGQDTLLFGVTFALLDLAEEYPIPLSNTTIIETGGMKGRRKELIREEVHMILHDAFGVEIVHSEYGMTELLSQAYSKGKGLFRTPAWMRVLIREEDDPFMIHEKKGRGGINIIDLANIHSCCFIATDDAGILYEDGSFKILGRLDNSDIRGCSLLAL